MDKEISENPAWKKPKIKTLGSANDLIQGWNGKDLGPTDGQAAGLQFDS